MCLSGAKRLPDPSVCQFLSEWVAHYPLAKGPLGGGHGGWLPLLHRDKQIVAVKQYASLLLPAWYFIGLLMELNIPKTGFRHISEIMIRRGGGVHGHYRRQDRASHTFAW